MIKKKLITSIARNTGLPEKDIEAVLAELARYQEGDEEMNTIRSGEVNYSGAKMSEAPKSRILKELRKREGSAQILDRFLKLSRMPKKLMAEQVLEITPKTLNVYCHSDKELPTRINEQILKLETLYEKGIELFENAGQFNEWLRSDSYGLGRIKPITLVNSITGIDQIYEELVRIEFGATA